MNKELSKEQTDAILKALEDLIALGEWNSSAFLRVLNKKLQTIRDDFSSKAVYYRTDKPKIMSHLANRVAMRSGQQEIFVSLYSSDGGNVQSWERIVMNLPRQIISRPIYANEADVIEAIRAKENKINEAYISVYVNESDLLPMGDKTPVDKFGKPLLTLKDRCIQYENMNRFFHSSGVYLYQHGRLIKETFQED